MSKFVIINTMLISIIMARHINLRERKRHRKIIEERFNTVFRIGDIDKEYLDGILHFKKGDKSFQNWRKVADIEKDFRRSIAMDGMKYIFKRDLHWRTRRKVVDDNGKLKVICYKCNNLLPENHTGCDNCGLWTIEEKPPCPFEIYSLIDKYRMCGHDYLNTKNYKALCPSIIKFTDLSPFCDNPMETRWRFTSDFNGSKKFKNIICNGNYYCEIVTTYLITPQYVVFRMINATNDVIYSRIMKPNNMSYVCVNDCGHYDPITKKIIKVDDSPLKLNLLSIPKNRKDLIVKEESMVKSSLKKRHLSLSKRKKGGILKFFEQEFNTLYSRTTIKDYYIVSKKILSPKVTTMSTCQRLQKIQETYEEPEEYEYLNSI